MVTVFTRKIKSNRKYEVGDLIYCIQNLTNGEITDNGTFEVLSCNESTSAYIEGGVYELTIKRVDSSEN